MGCKWVFENKTNMNGKVHTYKTWLGVKGFKIILGVDYNDIFSPNTFFRFVWVLLVIAAYHYYEI